MTATGQVPKIAPKGGTASTLPSQYPIAHVKGTIGGTSFTLDIVPDSPGVAGARYTTDLWSRNGNVPRSTCRRHAHCERELQGLCIRRHDRIAPYHGPVSQPVRHGLKETAHATFDVAR